MTKELSLRAAQRLVSAALKAGRELSLKPLSVVVCDSRATIRALATEDGTGLRHPQIAMGKANAALALGVGSRTIAKAATERPHFVPGVAMAAGNSFVPVPGGVLIRNGRGHLLGAIAVTGDTADNDERAAVMAVEALGLTADPGI